MPLSAVCARIGRLSDGDGQGDAVHGECDGTIRYLEHSTGSYVEGKCGCSCHIEKREWYLSDFGPGPHKILWVNDRSEKS